MSLLIDALKKKRNDDAGGYHRGDGGAPHNEAPKNPKKIWVKIVVYVLAAFVLVVITAFVSFKIIHSTIEKKEAEIREKLGGAPGHIKEKLLSRMQQSGSEESSGGGANSADQNARRAKIAEMLQKRQTQSNSSNSDSSSDDASSDNDSSSSTTDAGNSSDSSASATSGAGSIRERLRAKRTQQLNTSSASSNDSSSSAPSDSDDAGDDSKNASNSASLDSNDAGDDSKNVSDGASSSSSSSATSDASSDTSSGNDNSSPDSGVSSNASFSNNEQTENPGIAIVKTDWSASDDELYKKAEALADAHEYAQAIAILEEKDTSRQTQGQSALLLGRLYLQANNPQLAQTYLQSQLQNPGYKIDGLTALLGQAYFTQGKYQAAIDTLMQRAPRLSKYPTYYSLLARSYMRIGDPSSAVQILQQLVAEFPNSSAYWLTLALAYQQSNDVESAIVSYRRAVDLNEDNPQVLLFVNKQLSGLQ